MSTALATLEPNRNAYGLTAYGTKSELDAMIGRVMDLHPAARDVGRAGIATGVQLAFMVGAIALPSTNEVHIWKDNKGRVCVDLGINFYRRKAQELGGILWQIRPRQMNDKERQEYGVANGQIAAICSACRVEDMMTYRAAGFKTNEIWDMAADVGIGMASGTEYAPNGRNMVWRAMMRAEKDLYRRLFPIMSQWGHTMSQLQQQRRGDGVVIGDDGEWVGQVAELGEMDADPIDGQFTDAPPVDLETGEIAELDNKLVDLRAGLECIDAPTFGEVAQAAVNSGLYDNEFHALNAMKTAPLVLDHQVTVKKSGRITNGGAVTLFDWLMERKSEMEQPAF